MITQCQKLAGAIARVVSATLFRRRPAVLPLAHDDVDLAQRVRASGEW